MAVKALFLGLADADKKKRYPIIRIVFDDTVRLMSFSPPEFSPSLRKRRGFHLFLVSAALLVLTVTGRSREPRDASALASLKHMSLDDLLAIEVTSVSRQSEKLTQAPSAIQVITGDDIRRSTATTLPEALRLASNLQSAQLNSYSRVIGARGFNGDFANKLLVMIDGRSVYTPLFAGVLWDVQNTLLEDVDRIEVISGPGGSLWGSNAVNGVINIITKSARETQGTYATALAGSGREEAGAVRYGGRIGENLYFRVYGQSFRQDNTTLPSGADAADSWNMTQGGFRMDYLPSAAGTLTLQGDLYNGTEHTAPTNSAVRGENLLGRWTRTLAPDSTLRVQAYYDHTWRRDVPSTITDSLTTFDLDLQHGFPVGSRQSALWGVEGRLMRDHVVTSTALIGLLPPQRDMALYSGFLQDEIALVPDQLKLTVGTKLEYNDFSGFEVQPSVRLAWIPTDNQTVWGAISRAVRSPSRFDTDYYLPKAAPHAIAGGPDFDSEKLIAYELGYRVQPRSNLSLSFATYVNEYTDLYNVQTATFPYTIENGAEGSSWGVEISGTWQPMAAWRLRGGYNFFDKHLHSKPGHVAAANVLASLGHDPQNQFSLQSMLTLRPDLDLDITVRYVSALPDPYIPSYVAFDLRLAWQTGHWEYSLVGENLGDPSHSEFGTFQEIPRTFYGKVSVRF
jgi:iron complex outermembrane receptor protein